MNDFTQAYIECALWASRDDRDDMDNSLEGYTLAPATVERMEADCAAFARANAAELALAGDDQQNGHDYWLTRNRHGAGFWDRGYPLAVAGALTEAAHADGGIDLYVGDDGLVYAQ
jgi:hypothetical protein